VWRQKDPTTVALFETHHAIVTSHLASWERTDARLRRAGQLAEPVLSLAEGLKQGPPIDESVPPLGQTAGVGPGRDEYCRGSDERARNHIFCMIPNSFVPFRNNAPY